MSVSSEKVADKVPWLLVVGLSLFLGTFGIAWLNFLPSSLRGFYNFGTALCVINVTSAPLIVFIFTAIFSKVTKKKISLVTLTYLYVIAMTCSWYVYPWNPFEFQDIVASRHMNEDWSATYVPVFMAPPADITRQLVTGAATVPWGDWLPSIMYHWILFILLGFFYISVATLFRRQWVDVDRVPFPHALIAYELMRRIPEERKSLMEKLGKPFLLGIILGLAYQIPIFMTSIFPWFPDIYGWKTVCASGQWYITSDSPLASIVGLSTFQKHPAAVAIGYLVPLSISFNAWFWHLVYMILMQVAYAMGYYSGIETAGGCGRAWCSPTSGLSDPPFNFSAVSYGGGLFGLTVITLILSRGYIGETLRAAFQKPSGRLEIEKNEALTYRNTYILLASSFILLVILFMVDGMGAVAALLILISYFLYWIANARLYGLAGIQACGGEHGNTLFRFMWPTAPDPPTREYVLAAYYSRNGINSADSVLGGAIFTGFNSYKMASITGTSNSNVLKVMLVATVITPVVVLFTFIWQCYTYGGTALPGNGGYVQSTYFYSLTNPDRWIRAPAREPLAPYVLAGFLIVAVLEFLHARFVWFPFNAIGFIIGTSYISVLWGYWGTFLIAWILKFITLRVGGSKLYDNLGVPIACGYIVGHMVALIFGGTMGVLRFFFPY